MTPTSKPSKNRISWLDKLPSVSQDPVHPAQIALRTYALTLSLSLGPPLARLAISSAFSPCPSRSSSRLKTLSKILQRELRPDGFAFALTLAAGGGATIRRLWDVLDRQGTDAPPGTGPPAAPSLQNTFIRQLRRWSTSLSLSDYQRTFISNLLSSSLGFLLLQSGRLRSRRLRASRGAISGPSPHSQDTTSPTIDLTLLLAVRTLDTLVQSFVFKKSGRPSSIAGVSGGAPTFGSEHSEVDERQGDAARSARIKREQLRTNIDAFIFWLCSARLASILQDLSNV
jgi:hypothetical protein